MTFLDELYADLLAEELDRPRSQQVEIGGSGLFGCRAEHVLRLNGVPQSDPRLSWEAFVGSAIDHRIGEARLRRRPHLLVQQRLEYRGVFFTIDEYDKNDRTLSDWKTKDSAGACSEAVAMMRESRAGHDQKRAQLHGGAAALRAAGHEVDQIRLVFLPRAGDFDGAQIFEEPFSQEWADKGVEWAADVMQIKHRIDHEAASFLASDHGFGADPVSTNQDHAVDSIDGLRDKPPFFCQAYCPFVTTCRGENATADTVDPDPILLDAAQRYVTAKLEADESAQRRDYYRGLLQGAPPIVTEGWKIAWSGGREKVDEEVDLEAVKEAYEIVIGPLPTREVVSQTTRSLRATKVRAK